MEVEIKATIEDFDPILRKLEEKGAEFDEPKEQKDIYLGIKIENRMY